MGSGRARAAGLVLFCFSENVVPLVSSRRGETAISVLYFSGIPQNKTGTAVRPEILQSEIHIHSINVTAEGRPEREAGRREA